MIRLGNTWRYLCKTSWRCLEDVLKTFLQDVFKTFWRRLHKTSWKRLEDIFRTSWRRMAKTNILVLTKTSLSRLEDIFWRRMAKTNIFVLIITSWRRLLKTNVCWELSICIKPWLLCRPSLGIYNTLIEEFCHHFCGAYFCHYRWESKHSTNFLFFATRWSNSQFLQFAFLQKTFLKSLITNTFTYFWKHVEVNFESSFL